MYVYLIRLVGFIQKTGGLFRSIWVCSERRGSIQKCALTVEPTTQEKRDAFQHVEPEILTSSNQNARPLSSLAPAFSFYYMCLYSRLPNPAGGVV